MNKIIILIVLAISLLLRLYKIDNPIADWHSWRQADTASVTQEFINRGIDLLHPHYQDLSNIPSGLDNPEGYRMVEFPIYNLVHYFVYSLNPQWGIDMSGRLTSVFISLISLVFIYLIVAKISGKGTAIIASLLFGTMPFSVYYSRVVLPEPLMILFLLSSFYFFLISLEKKSKKSYFLLLTSALLFSLALLVKPYAIFFILPYIYLLAANLGNLPYKLYWLPLFAILSALPLLSWRWWIGHFPSGIPASDWLYNLNGIRFRPAWFRWLFAERLGKLILGYWGIAPFIVGLASHQKRIENCYLLWFVGIIAYFSVFAGGNVTHDYYQAIITPFIAMILAKGITGAQGIKMKLAMVICSVLMIGFSWYEINGYYQINNWSIVKAGKAIDSLIPKDAKVIAPYNGDTAFLYQTRRSGWPAVTYDIKRIIDQGASYYVSVNYDDQTNMIMKDYPNVVEKNSDFVIIKLK